MSKLASVSSINDQKKILLVNGLINMIQAQLFSDEIDNPYYNAPELIIYLCIWFFYHQIETFSMSGPLFRNK